MTMTSSTALSRPRNLVSSLHEETGASAPSCRGHLALRGCALLLEDLFGNRRQLLSDASRSNVGLHEVARSIFRTPTSHRPHPQCEPASDKPISCEALFGSDAPH